MTSLLPEGWWKAIDALGAEADFRAFPRTPILSREVLSESDVRVVAVMNFYTRSCPESTRPPELNRHRFGDA